MKRYQKLLGPISLAMCAWGAGIVYCSKNGECGKPLREIIESVSAAMFYVKIDRCYGETARSVTTITYIVHTIDHLLFPMGMLWWCPCTLQSSSVPRL